VLGRLPQEGAMPPLPAMFFLPCSQLVSIKNAGSCAQRLMPLLKRKGQLGEGRPGMWQRNGQEEMLQAAAGRWCVGWQMNGNCRNKWKWRAVELWHRIPRVGSEGRQVGVGTVARTRRPGKRRAQHTIGPLLLSCSSHTSPPADMILNGFPRMMSRR